MDNKSQNKDIELYLDRLIEEKKFEDVDEGVMAQIKEDLRDRVENRINLVILENMPPEKLEEFEKLLDTASADEIQKFCQENIADLSQVIAKALLDFRRTYLNL